MSDANLQRCNVCKKVNVDEASDWVRLPGGAVNANIKRPLGLVALDFCPDCAAKTNVKDVPALMPVLPQPMVPRFRTAPPVVAAGQPIPTPPAQPPET